VIGAVLVADEAKRNSVRCGPADLLRWELWLKRAQQAGRAVEVPGTSGIPGCQWALACDSRADAEWLRRWLTHSCGFTATMLRIRGAAAWPGSAHGPP
jgi:hypothetical protein